MASPHILPAASSICIESSSALSFTRNTIVVAESVRGNDVVPMTSFPHSRRSSAVVSWWREAVTSRPCHCWPALNIKQIPLLSMTSRSGHDLPRVLAPFPPDSPLTVPRPVPRRTKRSNACIACKTRRIKVIAQLLATLLFRC